MHPAHAATRRQFLGTGLGLGALALADFARADDIPIDQARPLAPRAPHFAPKASAMISLFMQGGPSHVDLCDPKPELQRLDGQKFPGEVKYDNAAQASSKVLGCPWKFTRHGQCGMDFSELLPATAGIAVKWDSIGAMFTATRSPWSQNFK